ncbi:MAG: polysaccharide biosynthesis protein, partial [Oscillospiraceae bacterium]|nr:polysaccharide biosynthesis protein [Oscillospiraceae bacterium]
MTGFLHSALARNTALLTASALVMRLLGLMYQVWLAGHIGAAGIGLFQLVLSAGMLFSTLA